MFSGNKCILGQFMQCSFEKCELLVKRDNNNDYDSSVLSDYSDHVDAKEDRMEDEKTTY